MSSDPLRAATARGGSFGAYAAAWLARRARQLQPRTCETYGWVLSIYILPSIGTLPLDAVTRAVLRDTFDRMAMRGYAPRTIRLALAVTTAILNDAVDAECLAGNPVGRLGRRYRGPRSEVAIYDARQLAAFLATAQHLEPALAPLFAVCAGAGLRVGEARGLQGTDCDLAARRLRVVRQISHRGGADTSRPKGGKVRGVDLAASLVDVLAPLVAARPGWLFPEVVSSSGYKLLWTAFRRIATAAGLPVLTMHSLRHGFASTLISRGVSPVYVQRALGHAQISLTVDLYGSHLPMERPAVLDGL